DYLISLFAFKCGYYLPLTYKSINNRYRFISNYFSHVFHVAFDKHLKDNEAFKMIMSKTIDVDQYKRYKLNKSLPESVTIDDIINDMQKSRFLIRPPYQRSEVLNVQKASYLLESIMLGIQIPPIFIYKRNNKVKEVIDGQQRLLTILGFLGKSYIDENGNFSLSQKDRFKLIKLRILSELNGKNIDTLDEKYIDKIYDFPIDIVEIEQEQNPDFNEIDLFLRLNTKPYPIKENTFEMWNAYADKDIIMAIKALTEKYVGVVFRAKDSRMKNEELVTSLAYIDFKLSREHSCITDVLNVYKRYGRISARIIKKESITRTLSDVSNSNPLTFLQSVKNIEVFAKKVLALIDNDSSKMNGLFSHKRKGTQCKTDQNFYFLWVMLKNITIEDICNRKREIFSKISYKFSILQNTPEDYTVEMFLTDLGSI
ncbi:DUF262 domain-containing protein, partial [Clostridium thermosuccinogenes]|uniref:DUF262 domain-containing protein n=2 Tax=Clostridium thermosuccinogenes TaxID=84032 RepID=UPI001056F38D